MNRASTKVYSVVVFILYLIGEKLREKGDERETKRVYIYGCQGVT